MSKYIYIYVAWGLWSPCFTRESLLAKSTACDPRNTQVTCGTYFVQPIHKSTPQGLSYFSSEEEIAWVHVANLGQANLLQRVQPEVDVVSVSIIQTFGLERGKEGREGGGRREREGEKETEGGREEGKRGEREKERKREGERET